MMFESLNICLAFFFFFPLEYLFFQKKIAKDENVTKETMDVGPIRADARRAPFYSRFSAGEIELFVRSKKEVSRDLSLSLGSPAVKLFSCVRQ